MWEGLLGPVLMFAWGTLLGFIVGYMVRGDNNDLAH